MASVLSNTIPIVHASEFKNADEFYHKFYNWPVVIKGLSLLKPTVTAENILEKFFPPSKPRVVYALDSETQATVQISSLEFLKNFKEGASKCYNIVSHEDVGPEVRAAFEEPFFAKENWLRLDDVDHLNLLPTMICSPKGAYTSLHCDENGLHGFMYLLFGKKRWTFIEPKYYTSLFDFTFGEFYNERNPEHISDKQKGYRYTLADNIPKYQVTIEGGDLVYLPVGWIHYVDTDENSAGIGSSILNGYSLIDTLKRWLMERSLFGSAEDDLQIAKIIREKVIPKKNEYSKEIQENIDNAIQLLDRYKAMVELGGNVKKGGYAIKKKLKHTFTKTFQRARVASITLSELP